MPRISTRARLLSASGARGLAVLTATSLLLTACTGAEPTPEPPAPTADNVAVSTAGLHLQDIWIFHDITGVDADGSVVSVLDEAVAGLRDSAETPIQLSDALEFSPLPGLEGKMVSANGVIHDEITVSFGLFGVPESFPLDESDVGAQTFGLVTSAPKSTTNVASGDELVFDTKQIPALEGYESVLLDYVFAQAKPIGGDAEDGLAPLEVLKARFDAQTVAWTGTDVDGSMEAVMWSGVAGNRQSLAAEAMHVAANTATNATHNSQGGSAGEPIISQAAFQQQADIVPIERAGGGGFMGFPIKASFTGAGGLVITAYCLIVGAMGGPAGVVLGAVLCTAIGVVLVINDVFNAIKDNQEGGKDRDGRSADSSGDPHLTTFDGARHGLMTVGEFDMVIMEDFHLQLRTAPPGSSRRVTVNTAAAMNVAGDTVVVDAFDGAAASEIKVNGEVVQLRAGEPLRLEQGGVINLFGNAIDVEWPDGNAVVIRVYGTSLDAVAILVDQGSSPEGLFGNFDGDPSNDFATRDGEQVPEFTTEQFYQIIAESWRVTDDSNLFGTPLTHDRSFPDLSEQEAPDNLAWATAICEAAGLSGSYLEDCILDVSATGDVGFAHRMAISQGLQAPVPYVQGSERGAGHGTISGVDLAGVRGVLDETGEHLLVATRASSGDEHLHALRLTDTHEEWKVPMFATDCGFAVAADNRIVVPFKGVDGIELQIVDATNGNVRASLPAPALNHYCSQMAAADQTVIIGVSGDNSALLGVDTAAEKILFDTPLPGLVAGPVRAHDGALWVVTEREDNLTAHRVDSATGRVTSPVQLPGEAVASRGKLGMVATDDGFVISVSDEAGGSVVRVAGSRVAWRAEFPVTIEGKEVNAPQALAADGDIVVGYSSSDRVVVLDAGTGSAHGTFQPSSFNNNYGQIAVNDGKIVVGTFGSHNWLEAYDPVSLELAWSEPAPGGLEVNDIKQIVALGEYGVLVQTSIKEADGYGVLIKVFKK